MFISIKIKYCFADTPTYALVKLYFHCCTTFQTFQDLFELTFVYIYVIYEIFFEIFANTV